MGRPRGCASHPLRRGDPPVVQSEYTRARDRGEILTTLGEAPSLARAQRRRAPDWRPAVDPIVALAEPLGKTDTPLQSAAFTLLKQSVRLSRAALDDDREALLQSAKQAERALRKVIRNLEE